jgi:hypothetical protein
MYSVFNAINVAVADTAECHIERLSYSPFIRLRARISPTISGIHDTANADGETWLGHSCARHNGIMAFAVQPLNLSSTYEGSEVRIQPNSGRRKRTMGTPLEAHSRRIDGAPSTVFDLLYREYLPFRLYASFMLGESPLSLAAQFGLREDWVIERIEAVRLCLDKQVRLNLLEVTDRLSTVQ